jgi:hypothetical protein
MLTPRPAQVVFNPVASGIDLTPEQAPVDTSLGAVVGAAFARENVIGSLLAHQWSSSEIDPALTWDIIWDSIKGTKYEAYSDKFAAEVHNFGALAAMKRNIDLREEHDRTLAAAGLWGGVASFGAGLVSPENLVPGGAIVRGVRMGAAIGRSFLNTAAAAAVSTTAGEGVLLATQPTRSPLESAANVAGAAVFGGSFGGAIAAVAGRADIARATRAAVANVSARSGVPQADLSPEIRGEAIRAEVQAAIEGRAGGDASGPSVSATVADASERIRPLLDFKRRPGSETSVVDIAPVSPPLAQIVRRHTGIDVTRYTHVIDAASVRRILQPNDDLDVGLPHGRLPVTDEDVVAIPSVLANATHVVTGIRLSEHRTAVGYISRAFDGSVVYLEQQVVRSRRRLVTRAIRKYPPETTPESIAASLDTTVRRAPGEFLTLTEIAPGRPRPESPIGFAQPAPDTSTNAPRQSVEVKDGVPVTVERNSESTPGAQEKAALAGHLEGTAGAVASDQVQSISYARPSGYRDGVREQAWQSGKSPDGLVRDPLTRLVMDPAEPWDMGHRPGYEFRKHQRSALRRGITRKQFLDEHNDPAKYRPELPGSNRSGRAESEDDEYAGD